MNKETEEAYASLVQSIEKSSLVLFEISDFGWDFLKAMNSEKRRRVRLFLLGWRRQSAVILDAAGCPGWLRRWRCPTLNKWGAILHELTKKEEARGETN